VQQIDTWLGDVELIPLALFLLPCDIIPLLLLSFLILVIGLLLTRLLLFSERELTFTFAICRRPSVCRLSVCNVHAPYSDD